MTEINGKTYPMWSQFAEGKEKWIGGVLQEIDSIMGAAPETAITDVTLGPNGDESAIITCHGKEYSCGYDVKYCGVGAGEEGWLTIYSQWGDGFRVKRPSLDQ